MTSITKLKVNELRGVAWKAAKDAIGTPHQQGHCIRTIHTDKKTQLINHITNTLGITTVTDNIIDLANEWISTKDSYLNVMDRLINELNETHDNGREQQQQQQQRQQQQSTSTMGDTDMKQQMQDMQSMLQQLLDSNNQNHKKRTNSARNEAEIRNINKQNEEDLEDPDEVYEIRDTEQISIASNKRIRKESELPVTPALNSINNFGGASMSIHAHNFNQQAGLQIQSQRIDTEATTNIISQAVKESSLNSDLMTIPTTTMEKVKTGQSTDLTQLLPKVKSDTPAASSSTDVTVSFGKDGQMKWLDKDFTETMLGKKRHITSFAELAEVMVHTMIGKMHTDDIKAASGILTLFSHAITINRNFSYKIAHYYVEAALQKGSRLDSDDIDNGVLNAAMTRGKWNPAQNRDNRPQYIQPLKSTSTSSNNNSSTETCKRFNTGYCKFGVNCRFKHICSNCGKEHAANSSECKDTKRDRSNPPNKNTSANTKSE